MQGDYNLAYSFPNTSLYEGFYFKEIEMKDGTYITIQSWMRTDLGLSGNELMAYALIFGFSQDDETMFRGSIRYVADWLGCSRQTAITTLKKLVEKHLVERIEETVNGVLFVRYKTMTPSQEILQGESKNLTEGSQKTLPDNISKENNKGKDSIYKPTLDEIERFCKERGNGVDAKRVYDYYSSADWKDGKGNPVRNWKQKIIAVWERNNGSKPSANIGKVAHESEAYLSDFNADGSFKWE